MRTMVTTSVKLVLGAVFTVAAVAQGGGPPALSQAEARSAILERTHIGICAKADPAVFTSVLTAPAIQYKVSTGSQETRWLYPVKASYTVHCTQGNPKRVGDNVYEWQIEVQADYRLYKDPYSQLQVADNFDSDWSWDDQYWNDAHADVRCRAKLLSTVQYDASGNVSKRTEGAGKAYGDCNVRMTVPK